MPASHVIALRNYGHLIRVEHFHAQPSSSDAVPMFSPVIDESTYSTASCMTILEKPCESSRFSIYQSLAAQWPSNICFRLFITSSSLPCHHGEEGSRPVLTHRAGSAASTRLGNRIVGNPMKKGLEECEPLQWLRPWEAGSITAALSVF